MIEALDFYRQLDYHIVAALVFILGLVIGSFSNVLYYRLPRRMSLSVPRSHCPSCGHTLGSLDLVPVLSWLLLGRRCRYCKAPISGRYPLIELGCGLVAAAGALLAGWAGGFGAICLWLLGVWGLAIAKRQELTRNGGSSLVELLVAVGLLAMVAVPMLDMAVYNTSGVEYQRKVAATLASDKLEEMEYVVYFQFPPSNGWPSGCPNDYGPIPVGAYRFRLTCMLDDVPGQSRDWLRLATVTAEAVRWNPDIGDYETSQPRVTAKVAGIIGKSGCNFAPSTPASARCPSAPLP